MTSLRTVDNNSAQARQLDFRGLVLIGLVGFGPLMAQFFFNLWHFSTYQFFPLAIAGAFVLAQRGCSEAKRPLISGSKRVTIPAIVLVFGLLTVATVMWSPWLGVVAFLFSVIILSWWLGGAELCRALLPSWLMFLTLLPPPLKLDTRLALQLQEWAVSGSSSVLAIIGVPHTLSGSIIDVPDQRLLVEEACSGINSVLFMTSACVFYALWRRRSLLFLIVLYALTIGYVLAGNLLRITSGAFLLVEYRIDLFSGWKHEALGLVLTATYLGFIVAADAIIAKLLTDHSQPLKTPETHTGSILQGRACSGGVRWVGLILVILGAAQVVRGWDFHVRKEKAKVINPSWMNGEARFEMPAELDGWRLVSQRCPVPKRAAFEDGVYSHIWQYAKDGIIATISLDYPFFGYHDVTVCYRNAGWQIGKRALDRASPENNNIPAMIVDLTKPGGLNATLLYSTVDESGVWLENTAWRSAYDENGNPLEDGSLTARLVARMRKIPYLNPQHDDQLNYRIQALSALQGGLNEARQRALQKFFHEARTQLAAQFVEIKIH